MPTSRKAKVKKEVIFLFALVVGFSFFSTESYAVEVILVDQPKVRLSIPPGSSKSGVINVENHSPETKNIRVYLEDWVYLPEADGSKEFKPARATELSCTEWINFSPAEFTLPSFSKRSVHYTVSVPKGTVGGRYAVLFFEDILSTPGEEGVTVGVAIRVASLFYVEAEETIKRDAQLSNLSLIKKGKDALQIEADFKNVGNVDITCSGTFHVVDKKGMVFARGEFNDVYTFPGDTAKLTGTWKEPLSKGKYDLILTLNLGKALQEAGLGRGPVMTKEADIEIGDKGEVIRAGELR